MNVLLLQPREAAEPIYPLALAGVAAALLQAGCLVRGLDLHFGGSYRRPLAPPPDWVVCRVSPHTASQARACLAELRAAGAGRTLVFGWLPSLDARAALDLTGADVSIAGDPELVVPALVGGADPASLPGCAWRGGPPPAEYAHAPLGGQPSPDRTIFPLARYGYTMRALAHPFAAIATSRGCRRTCPYCAGPRLHPYGFEARDSSAVRAELAWLAREHGVRSALVEDDAFLADAERVRDLCDRLKAEPVPLLWELVNGVRPQEAEADLFSAMASAGCRRVVFSFEEVSVDGPVRGGCTAAEAERAVAIAREAGMRVGGYFILGAPDATPEALLSTLRAASLLALDDANLIAYRDAPGSAWADRAAALPGCTRALAALGQVAFLARPRSWLRLARDLRRTPRTAPWLARKAAEWLGQGGPQPGRFAL